MGARMRRSLTILALGLLTLSGCGGGGAAGGPAAGGGSGRDRLTIAAYSVVREAFHEALLPAFAKHWKKSKGREVSFSESYEGSGAQARKVKAGFEADVAVLSLEGDMDLLAEAGLVNSDWKAGPSGGMITTSLVVIGHREGNPKGIKDWPDLAKPGVGVLYPDPKTSGGAKWNVGAIYGAALLHSKEKNGGKADLDAVRATLAAVQANVINMDASGRQSMATFERKTGDAIVTYENELLLRKREGREIPYLIPESTLRIEGPAAVIDANAKKNGTTEVAQAFLDFLRSEEGQAILADYGFRPVDAKAKDATGRPKPARLFTVEDLGGWKALNDGVFGPKGLWTSVFAADRAPGGK